MGAPKVFIDGHQGSTGLRIRALLDDREDLELTVLPERSRKDREARRAALGEAEVAILCLPDDASVEALELLEGTDTRVIDASSARRTAPGWVYGLPEMAPGQRAAIAGATRVANPGCFPQSFILAVRPLIEAGVLDAATPFTINAVSGYSGGGRRMIERYERAPEPAHPGDARMPLRLYGLDGRHKHLPEMHRYSLAEHRPLFVPSVDHAYSGMLVSVPLSPAVLGRLDRDRVHAVWEDRYRDEHLVRALSPAECDAALADGSYLELCALAGTNLLALLVVGDRENGLTLVGQLDNLGKGAAGSAVQCLNLMLGVEETKGLVDEDAPRRRAAS